MAFENIDVTSLKSALNSCKNSINNSYSTGLKTHVVNSDIWHCDARNNLKGSLDRLERQYNNLIGQLNSYLSIADQIEEYQKLAATNNDLRKQYNDLSGRLWKEEKFENHYYEERTGTWEPFMDTRKIKDVNVESQMNSINAQIESNESSMEKISTNVASSL